MKTKLNIFQKLLAGWVSRRPQANVYNGPLTIEQIGAMLQGGMSKSGLPISETGSMNLSYVFQCMQVLRQTVAQISLITYERLDPVGKKRAFDHPLYWVLAMSPDSVTPTSIYQVKQMIMTSMVLRGNFYAAIVRNDKGDVIQLWPMNNDRVEPFRDEKSRKKMFRVTLDSGKKEVWPSSKILHLMDYTDDGIIGLGRIKQNRDAIGLSKQAENFGSEFFANGAHPGLSVTTEKNMDDPGVQRFKEELASKSGGGGGVWWDPLVLDEGMKWTSPTIDDDDMQLLETRKFQKTEIGAIFRVPEHMINDLTGATLTNIDSLTLSFVTLNLMPNLVNIENEMMMQLLPREDWSKFLIEFLVDSLLRGDALTRAKISQIEILTGYGTPNESRVRENRNPKSGGDELRVPLNVTMLDDDGKPISITMAESGDAQARLQLLKARSNN